MTHEDMLNCIGYGRWLYEQGKISKESYLKGIEEVKQKQADTVAAELLAEVDLSGLESGEVSDG